MMMRLDKFEALLEAKGTDPAAWPWRQRYGARRLLRHSAVAREALQEARTFDALLVDALQTEPAGEALKARLRRIPQQHPRRAMHERTPLIPTAFWYAGSATVAASLLAGILVGATLPSNAQPEVDMAGLVYGISPSLELLP